MTAGKMEVSLWGGESLTYSISLHNHEVHAESTERHRGSRVVPPLSAS